MKIDPVTIIYTLRNEGNSLPEDHSRHMHLEV